MSVLPAVLSVLLASFAFAFDFASVEVTYVANEGFLLAAGDVKVLIDGAYRGGPPPYAAPTESALRDIESASGIFAGVDVVLVSHRHADHLGDAATTEDALFFEERLEHRAF